ncbi:hypothetical protein ACFQU7_22015, partial [Pseudoroseomonas wenyumeiae]
VPLAACASCTARLATEADSPTRRVISATEAALLRRGSHGLHIGIGAPGGLSHQRGLAPGGFRRLSQPAGGRL